MGSSILQASFVGGELTPSAHGRTDLQRYGASLRRCRRFIVTPHGGVTKSTGFRFVASVGTPVHLERFRTSTDTHFLLVFGHHTLDIYLDGERVNNPLPPLKAAPVTFGPAISNIRYPMLCAGAGFTTDMVGKVVFARSSETSTECTAWRIYQFVSAGEVYVESLDHSGIGTDFPAIPVAGYACWSIGEEDRTAWPGQPMRLVTPWSCGLVHLLRTAQINDVMTVAHPDTPPMRLERRAGGTWALTNDSLVNGPFGEWDTSDTAITVTLGADGVYVLTAAAPIFSTRNIDQLIEIEPQNYGSAWQAATDVVEGALRRSEGNYYRAKVAGKTGTLPPSHTEGVWSDGVVDWEFVSFSSAHFTISDVAEDASGSSRVAYAVPTRPIPPGLVDSGAPEHMELLGTLCKIAGRGLMFECPLHGYPVGTVLSVLAYGRYDIAGFEKRTLAFRVKATAVDANHLKPHSAVKGMVVGNSYRLVVTLVQRPAGTSTATAYATAKWRLSPFGPVNGYPRSVVYHQQRKVFGGCYAFPQTVWLSRSGLYNDFGVSFPALDSDAITLTLDASDVSRVQGMLSIGRVLIFTSCGEWTLCGSTSTSPITATDRAFQQYGARGSADLPPIVVDDAAMFVQQKRRMIRDLDYDYSKDRYIGNDITVAAAHLFEGRRIASWTYEAQPFGVVWAACDDGTMLGCTFMREQQVVAWHRHDREGQFREVCAVPEKGDDALYAVCRIPSLRAATSSTLKSTLNATGYSYEKLKVGGGSDGFYATILCPDLSFNSSDVGRPATLVWPSGAFSATVEEVISTHAFVARGPSLSGAPRSETSMTSVTLPASLEQQPLLDEGRAALTWVAGSPGVSQPIILKLSGNTTRDFKSTDVGRYAYLRSSTSYVSVRITDVLDENTAYCGWTDEEPEWGRSFSVSAVGYEDVLEADQNGFSTRLPFDFYDVEETLERAGSRLDPSDPVTPYLDSSVVYSVGVMGRMRSGAAAPLSIGRTPGGLVRSVVFGGLGHLEGREVRVALNGREVGRGTVTGGQLEHTNNVDDVAEEVGPPTRIAKNPRAHLVRIDGESYIKALHVDGDFFKAGDVGLVAYIQWADGNSSQWIVEQVVDGSTAYCETITVNPGPAPAITSLMLPERQSHPDGLTGYYVVGLPYVAEVETLDIDFQSSESARDKNKLVSSVNVLCRYVNDGSALWAGPSSEQLNYSITASPQSWSDGVSVFNVVTSAEWSKRGSLILRSTEPGPMDILSVLPVIHVS